MYVEFFEKPITNSALESLDSIEGLSILDIGCGVGGDVIELEKNVGSSGFAIGLDIAYKMISRARGRVSSSRSCDFIVGDAKNLPFRNNVFDGVLTKSTLELFQHKEFKSVLNEVKRVLKPECWFLVASMDKEDGANYFIKLIGWLHLKFPKHLDCRPIHLNSLLEKNGFDIKELSKLNLFGFPFKVTLAHPI